MTSSFGKRSRRKSSKLTKYSSLTGFPAAVDLVMINRLRAAIAAQIDIVEQPSDLIDAPGGKRTACGIAFEGFARRAAFMRNGRGLNDLDIMIGPFAERRVVLRHMIDEEELAGILKSVPFGQDRADDTRGRYAYLAFLPK